MFVGRFEHTLDPKGRLVLPAAFRDQLAAGGYVAKGPDGCLTVMTTQDFEREAAEMVERAKRGEIDRNELRAVASGASPIKPDSQGRIVIPSNLREYAGLTNQVVVSGAFTSVEIWDAERWRAVDAQGDQRLAGTPT